MTRKAPGALPKNHPYTNMQQATYNNGFHEIRESTILEENETFAMSNKASDMINAFAKKQEAAKKPAVKKVFATVPSTPEFEMLFPELRVEWVPEEFANC